MMTAGNIHFEMAERSRPVNYGGIGAIHLMGQRMGLAEVIDGRLQLLKRHLPYHESDHVLNLAYNALLDGLRLELRDYLGDPGELLSRLNRALRSTLETRRRNAALEHAHEAMG